MIKIAVAIAVPLAVGFIVFPQFRTAIFGLAPFALFAICPLSMIFCMKGMGGDKKGNSCSSCGSAHTEAKHIQAKREE